MSEVLVVEDESQLASFLTNGLQASGFAVTVVSDGLTAMQIGQGGDFDLVLLDLGLPDLDGLDVLAALRRRDSQLPIIVLTARDDIGDKIAGFEGGADDYLTKPFRFEELLARMRARLRSDKRSEATELTVGSMRLDIRIRRAAINGSSVKLSPRECTLLERLMRHPGEILSREQLLSQVWGGDYDSGSNVVDVYIGYLRRKLGEGTIETVRGMGYRLVT